MRLLDYNTESGARVRVAIAGTIQTNRDRRGTLADRYGDLIDEFVMADHLGFDRVWLGELQHAEDAQNAACVALLTTIARQTERIRIANYLVTLAFQNPLTVAEDAALLDIVSDGRFDLGVGTGPMAGECAVFGIDRKTAAMRTFEALEIIERCWAGEPFVHSGEHFRLNEVANMPKPVQPGGPRIYVAATGPKSAAQTVERGYQFCLALGPSHEQFVDALRAASKDPQSVDFVSNPVGVHIADSADQAWAEADAGLREWLRFYHRRGAPFVPFVPEPGAMRHLPNFGFAGMPFAVGTQAQVAEQLQARYEHAPVDELTIQFHHGAMRTHAVVKSMQQFAELLPDIARWDSAK
jgi:alkanesulfonate monooxygenase SsuD/methylene tetrahydromethanopterin reductase-like flavin-dependent oxidoreductase (luciferase family)